MSSPPDTPDEVGRELRPVRLMPDAVDFEAVARISAQAELKTLRLAFLHADVDERRGAIPGDWSANAITGFNVDARLDRDDSSLTISCMFLAMWAPGLDLGSGILPSPKEAPFELHAGFGLVYELKDATVVEDADPEHFALTNGVLHAWPYWREIAHTTTVRMGLAPLLIGTFKLPWSGDPHRRTRGAE
jgi:hypothetical protein